MFVIPVKCLPDSGFKLQTDSLLNSLWIGQWGGHSTKKSDKTQIPQQGSIVCRVKIRHNPLSSGSNSTISCKFVEQRHPTDTLHNAIRVDRGELLTECCTTHSGWGSEVADPMHTEHGHCEWRESPVCVCTYACVSQRPKRLSVWVLRRNVRDWIGVNMRTRKQGSNTHTQGVCKWQCNPVLSLHHLIDPKRRDNSSFLSPSLALFLTSFFFPLHLPKLPAAWYKSIFLYFPFSTLPLSLSPSIIQHYSNWTAINMHHLSIPPPNSPSFPSLPRYLFYPPLFFPS